MLSSGSSRRLLSLREYSSRFTPATPMTGYVSRRAVQPGAQVSPTTPLMAVVPATDLWVDANFKETQ
ncbi:efflux RND transporter periplasmic adaptor subunit, partial [Salmonella enterica subsp. enterica serovar Cerro]|nr:efflux RND transporter periplasmic adaptor subunit [Salmonella enterica subsp. enterica serovar Cerro]